MIYFIYRIVLIKKFLWQLMEREFSDDQREVMFEQIKSSVIYYFTKFVSLIHTRKAQGGDGGIRKRR